MYWFDDINSIKYEPRNLVSDVGRLQFQGSINMHLIISACSASDTFQVKAIPKRTVIYDLLLSHLITLSCCFSRKYVLFK